MIGVFVVKVRDEEFVHYVPDGFPGTFFKAHALPVDKVLESSALWTGVHDATNIVDKPPIDKTWRRWSGYRRGQR